VKAPRRGQGRERRGQGGARGGVTNVHSHSIVAGGFELTS